MSERATSQPKRLSPLEDQENVDLRLVDDEPDEKPGLTPKEIDEFMSRPVPPMK